MSIEQRISVFVQLNTLTEQEANQLLEWIATLKEQFNIVITEENGSTLITHIASMIKRTRENDVILAMEPSIYGQLVTLAVFPLALDIHHSLSLIFSIPEEEKDYLMLHICTLLKEESFHE